jgi:hypothetical protein
MTSPPSEATASPSDDSQEANVMTITADHLTDTYETTRLAELEKEIPLLDKAMTDVRHRIEQWVECHPQDRTVFENGLPMMRLGSMEMRPQNLRALEAELNSLVALWHATLKEFADLKEKVRQAGEIDGGRIILR